MGKTFSASFCFVSIGKHPHERGEDQAAIGAHRKLGRNTPTSVGKTLPTINDWSKVRETPPRAWGRLYNRKIDDLGFGNTPTSVGKTGNAGRPDIIRTETPPRAWGRLAELLIGQWAGGNTPTSVGKTLDFTGVDGGLVEIRFVALSVFQSQGACLKFQ